VKVIGNRAGNGNGPWREKQARRLARERAKASGRQRTASKQAGIKRVVAKAKKPTRKAAQPVAKPAAPKPGRASAAPPYSRRRPAPHKSPALPATSSNATSTRTGQLRHPDAAAVPRATASVYPSASRWCTAAAPDMGRDLHALPPARLGAGEAGIDKGDTVTIMAPNIPEMYEAHFGVPMSGAVLNCLNTRLDAAMLAFILDHSETKVLLVDREYHGVMTEALGIAKVSAGRRYRRSTMRDRAQIGDTTWEEFIEGGDPTMPGSIPSTNGTRSRQLHVGHDRQSKGVVFHHRGATSQPTATPRNGRWHASGLSVDAADVPLQRLVLPVDAVVVAGTSICLRRVAPKTIFDALVDHKVTHMCGAPIIMQFIIGATPPSGVP